MVTFAHGSVANRALRQMFDNPLVNGANEQFAEPCRLFKGPPFRGRDHRTVRPLIIVEGTEEDGKRSTMTLGAIERLAGEDLGVNLQESKQIVNRPAFPACDCR